MHHLLVRRPAGGGEAGVLHLPRTGRDHLADLVRVAGSRWPIEECFQAARNETGLDHFQVRPYDTWYRHATLSVLALPSSRSPRLKRGTTACGQLSRTTRQHDYDDHGARTVS